MSAFPDVKKIEYEGPKSKNPLAFRWYNADEVVDMDFGGGFSAPGTDPDAILDDVGNEVFPSSSPIP